jgi:hypothetical protein
MRIEIAPVLVREGDWAIISWPDGTTVQGPVGFDSLGVLGINKAGWPFTNMPKDATIQIFRDVVANMVLTSEGRLVARDLHTGEELSTEPLSVGVWYKIPAPDAAPEPSSIIKRKEFEE